MGMWVELSRGYVTEVTYRLEGAELQNNRRVGPVDRLCQELGWEVDERRGSFAGLIFGRSERRRIWIQEIGDGIASFSTVSVTMIPARKMTNAVKLYLLGCNTKHGAVGAWEVVEEDGVVVFVLTYRPIGETLDAAAFRWICERMLIEARAFDETMRRSGIVR
jgi:hypothetical protein